MYTHPTTQLEIANQITTKRLAEAAAHRATRVGRRARSARPENAPWRHQSISDLVTR